MQAYAIDTDEKPKPGSPDAVTSGCTCPIMDNHRGKGRGGDGSVYGWYVVRGCPVHTGEPE